MKHKDTSRYTPGDSVTVCKGVNDPDFDADLSGWQGRIIDIEEVKGETFIDIQWDSITLKNMPHSTIEQCEEEGLDWAVMRLGIEQVEPAEPRDREQDTQKVISELEANYGWLSMGEEGRRIRNVLRGVEPDNDFAAMERWGEYLGKNLNFPFEAIVEEYEEFGPFKYGDKLTVKKVIFVDDHYGVIVNVRLDRKSYDIPLSDIEVVDEQSPNYQLVSDYRVWFANR
jgi:hypothetical protein